MGVPSQSACFSPDGCATAAIKAALAALPEGRDGLSTTFDTSVSGTVAWDRSLTPISPDADGVSNTSSETTLLASASNIVLPATWTTSGHRARLSGGGIILNNSGAGRDVTIRVKASTGAIWTWAFTGLTASASERTWGFDVEIVVYELVPGTVAFLVGIASARVSAAGGGVAEVRMSPTTPQVFTPGTALALDLTTQMSTNNANLKTTLATASIDYASVP